MKPWKRIAIAVLVPLAIVVVALAAAPLLFQDEIEARVKGAINERLDARVDFGPVGLNLFRSFPNLAFSLDDLTVIGVDAFEGDTLAHVGRFGLVVDLGSAIRALRRDDALVVRSILVDRPYVRARVLEDGRASWDIVKPAADGEGEAEAEEDGAEAGAGADMAVALRRFDITDARIAFDDATAGLHARIEDLDHTLGGDFTRDRSTLRTRTTADGVTVRLAGIPYLNGVRLEADAALDADLSDPAARRFTVRDNRFALNELAIGFDGSAVLLDDGAELDLTFTGERADFRHILSLVPALYLQDFASLTAGGTVAVGGHVKGRQGPDQVPGFGLNLDVADGMFQYEDLPLPVRDVFIDLAVANPGGDLDLTTVDLSRFDFALGDERFQATLAVATPVSDPDIDASFTGRVDLGAVSRAIPLEGVDQLGGTLATDAAVRTRVSWLEEERFDRVEATGRVELRDVAVSGDALPHPVAVDEMRLELAPSYADLAAFRARAGSSDVAATGRLDNLLGFVLRGEELRGRAAVESRYVNLDEWRTEESEEELSVIPVPANMDMTLTAAIDSMTFDQLTMTDARGGLRVKDQRVTLDEFALRTLDGQIVMSGWYETVDLDRPAFDLDFAMDGLDIPGAFAAFNTVRALAPAAGYATGQFSADLEMNGVLGADMAPVFDALNGEGGITTRDISMQGLPALHSLADAVRIDRLRDPALSDFAASIAIRDGRLYTRPFDVQVGGAAVTVSGSNGVDQSLDYQLDLLVPRDELGTDANRVVTGLLAESGRVGIDLGAAEAVRLDARVGGTMTRPTVSVDFGDAVASAGSSAREQVETRVREEADRRIEEARREAEEARLRREAEAREEAAQAEAEARARARAEADSIMAAAEVRADQIRAEAARLARSIRQEADQQADQLLEEASNPVSRRAAQIAGDRLRAQAEERATAITTEADRRAEQVLAEARQRADAVVGDQDAGS